MSYGCYNRAPFVAHLRHSSGDGPTWPQRMAKDCQYTLTDLGQADAACQGCRWRHTPLSREDIILWPDDTICYAAELEEFRHMSDDYERIPANTERWMLIARNM